MMKRVSTTRFGACAMLLAVFLLLGGAGSPAFAREDMSAGQSGDPGDGDEIFSTSGSTLPNGSQSNQTTAEPKQPEPAIIPVPAVSIRVLAFQFIVTMARAVVRR